MGVSDDRCLLIAGEQHGCISLAQALECGLSRDAVFRRARSGRWDRILPQVYAVRGAPASWEQRLFAAVLWGGEGAVLVGASAAALWKFPGFSSGAVEIAHPGAKRSREVVVHRMRLNPVDVTRLDGLPVTTPGQTLADVAVRLDGTSFDAAFHYCLHARLTSVRALRDLTARLSSGRRSGSRLLREALETYSTGGRPAASPLEARCARLLDRSTLPAPRRQYEVRCGGRRRYLDFAWPAARVAVEVDGYRWHSSRRAWESDRARARELRRAGWVVVQVTHDDIANGFRGIEEELTHLLGADA